MSELLEARFAPKGTIQFPRGSQLLVIGPPGVTKSTLVLRLLAQCLAKDEPCVYATTLWTPTQLRETIDQFVGEKHLSKLKIVDGVSCVTAKPSKEPFSFQNLYDLNSINLVLLQAVNEMGTGHLCIDNLTTLMTYSSPISVIKFLQVLCARVKNQKITGLYLLEEGVHEKEIVATLQFSVDGVIEVKDYETENELCHHIRMPFVRGTQVDNRWLLFHPENPLKLING